MKNKETEKIINKFKNIHGNLYDYSNVVYIKRLEKINIICYKHGEFRQNSAAHLSGQGCPECGSENRKQNKKIIFDEFLIRAIKKHGKKFHYNKNSYDGIEKNMKITCPIHGEFEQTPKTHIKSYGCPKCGNNSTSAKLSLTTDEFIIKSKLVHGDKYNYSLVEYKNNRTLVKLICNKHGIIEQKPEYHLSGYGCNQCGGTKKMTTEDFIEKSKLVHGEKYDYSLVEYVGNKLKIKIICNKHGVFEQSPSHHTRGSGCKVCNESKGEKLISWFLKKNKLIFERQKTFENCRDIRKLPFDFYLKDYNLCIEYDGEQHFEPWRMKDIEKSEKKFRGIQKRDLIKTDFCRANKVNLLRIKFNENIEEKIKNFLNENK